jgi:anti-sigma factor RsiW
VTHLGHRLSALIDGELDSEGRDRVLVHLAKCEPCRAEAVALRTLKRRMSALGGEQEDNSALTGRLLELAGLAASLGPSPWASPAGRPGLRPPGRGVWPEARPAWFMLGGAVTVFLAGLGTAAFVVGGSGQAPEPEPRVTPAVDVFMMQHDLMTGEVPAQVPVPVPDRAAPDRAAPDRTAPDRTAPGRTAPGRTAPGGAVPGSAVPGRAAPGRP